MQSKNLDFTIGTAPDLPVIHADRSLISRALVNYLENAAKYTEEHGQVVLRAFVEGRLLHVEVVDDGPGIPPEVQPRLFERFYRVSNESTDHIPGTGLGLAIVKSIAQKHGGSVYVRSQPGQGSTFGLTLALTSPA